MQATVSRFDHDTRSGVVILDDGVELPFEGGALVGTGLRFLRPGQRVRLEVTKDDADGHPRVAHLQILTLA